MKKRRWFSLSLRTLFVGMTLVCVVFAFVAHRRWKIAERERLERINDAALIHLEFVDSLLGRDFPMGEPVDWQPFPPQPIGNGAQTGFGGMGMLASGRYVYDDDYWWLRPIMAPELRSIRLSFLRDEVPPEWLPDVLMMPSIKEIIVSGDDPLSIAMAARFGASVETLRIEHDATIESLRSFGERQSVRHLFLEHSDVDDRLLMDIAQQFPALETLEIDSGNRCEVSPSGIAALGTLSRLTRLRMDGCELRRDHVIELAKLRSLRDLSLEGCDVNDEAIQPLKQLPRLRMLNVDWDISDERFKKIQGDWAPPSLCTQIIPIVG